MFNIDDSKIERTAVIIKKKIAALTQMQIILRRNNPTQPRNPFLAPKPYPLDNWSAAKGGREQYDKSRKLFRKLMNYSSTLTCVKYSTEKRSHLQGFLCKLFRKAVKYWTWILFDWILKRKWDVDKKRTNQIHEDFDQKLIRDLNNFNQFPANLNSNAIN